MMYEATLKPACALAVLLWIVGWAFVAVDLTRPSDDFGFIGIGLFAAAAILQIRGYYVAVMDRLQDGQHAFLLGQEAGRQEASVQRLR